MLPEYRQRAALSEDLDKAEEAGSSMCFFSVGRVQQWPFLVLTERYSPAVAGFLPGALLIPESHRLFVGAGQRLLAYDLERPARLWEDRADSGFWAWGRHGQTVLMSAELELAAWDVGGGKLWSRFVEPPWSYTVSGEVVAGEVVAVDVMGTVSRVQLRSGDPVARL